MTIIPLFLKKKLNGYLLFEFKSKSHQLESFQIGVRERNCFLLLRDKWCNGYCLL